VSALASRGLPAPGRAWLGRLAALPARRPWLVLAALLVVGGLAWLRAGTALSFHHEEWTLLTGDSILEPVADGPHVVPGLVWRVLLEVFGLDSYTPYRVVTLLTAGASCVLAFVLVRRAAGALLALCVVAPLAVYGAGAESLLWAYELRWLLPLACALGALVVAPRSDAAACALLCLAALSSWAGVGLAAGAAVGVLAAGDARRRAWIAVVPLVLLGAWWLAYGAGSGWDPDLTDMPAFLTEGIGASVRALLGLSDAWTSAATIAVVGLLALGAARGRATPTTWSAVAMTGGVWFMLGIDNPAELTGADSRFLFAGAVPAVVALGTLLRERDARGRGGALAVVLAALAFVAGLGGVQDSGDGRRGDDDHVRAEGHAITLAATVPGADLRATFDEERMPLAAREYLDAVARWKGTPADDATSITRRPSAPRHMADLVYATHCTSCPPPRRPPPRRRWTRRSRSRSRRPRTPASWSGRPGSPSRRPTSPSAAGGCRCARSGRARSCGCTAGPTAATSRSARSSCARAAPRPSCRPPTATRASGRRGWSRRGP
jgi:hypothetical protein